MKAEVRTAHVDYWLRTRLDRAKTLQEESFSKLLQRDDLSKVLKDLIDTNAKGFRGVVITSLVGYSIDHSFSPFIDFYACNPRSIFEQSIWYVLTEYKIPCGKSDPLNVAKNIQKLDVNWAKNRRPESAALAAISFMERYFNEQNEEQKVLIQDYFFFCLLKYSEKIASFAVAEIDITSVSRQHMAENLLQFALAAPESGATPQLLIARILQQIFADGVVSVCGGDESVFGTNTTSKKPADIWLIQDNMVTALFEITLKKVDAKRLEDCLEAHRALSLFAVPLTFICRIPEDISTLANINKNTFMYNFRVIEFVDFSSFVRSSFSLLTEESANEIYRAMKDFVGEITTSLKTKNIWNSIIAISNDV
jgi:hypothetical protein